ARIAVRVGHGFCGPRERMWEEPIYRNLMGFLREFGAAELAALVAPRLLAPGEPAAGWPRVDGPPTKPKGGGAAPGRLRFPGEAKVDAEIRRAKALFAGAEQLSPFRKIGDVYPQLREALLPDTL